MAVEAQRKTQQDFDALAEQEKFIMAYVIAEEVEGTVNSAATSRDDNDFFELSKSYCIDEEGCMQLVIH